MWREVRRESSRFRSGVVSGIGPAGTPVSTRVEPRVDRQRRVLVLDDPYPVDEGAASILFHRHDERLWHLRSCLVIGALTRHGDEWLFRPTRFVPGMGVGGALSYVRLLINGRKAASRYLAVRSLARPAVAWDEVADLLRRSGAPE